MTDENAFLLKGIGALVALVLLLWHMATTEGDMSLARALRYVVWLSAIGAVAFASQEQLDQGSQWENRQWGGVLVVVTSILASIASLLEDRGITLTLRRKHHDRTIC